MPRKLSPDQIKTGGGQRVPQKEFKLTLDLASSSGEPSVGSAQWANRPLPAWVRASIDGAGAGLKAHVTDPSGAHTSAAISHPDSNILLSRNVGGIIDELVGALPPEPPKLGQSASWTTFTGITDWGALKLHDSSLVVRGLLDSVNDAADIYPYYYRAPSPALGPQAEATTVFNPDGQDPQTDVLWNSWVDTADLPGGGPGITYAGAHTRDGTQAAPQTLVQTVRILARATDEDEDTGLPERQPVTISGMIYPADRGVLALIHWPPDGDPTDFVEQPLLDRCVAALLMGQGLIGSDCANDNCDGHVCDGSPGGIFAVGRAADGSYDPFAYPGRASGQYDLDEIHSGLNNLDGTDLREPWDGSQQRYQNTTVPAPGQVRLGTDPASGVDLEEYGIPILGGTSAAYNPAPTEMVQGNSVIGNSVIRFETTDTNFFRYRLPYLKDYETLHYTPRGLDPATTKETARYFEVASPHADNLTTLVSVGDTLPTAGNYGSPFSEDYFTWQIARYRHSFLMPSTALTGAKQEVGSYWLVHFKTEANFEAFVRDGVMPWDESRPYALYGAYPVATTSLEASANVVNTFGSGAYAPEGPAPDYGYVSSFYHAIRTNIVQEPDGVSPPTVTGTFTWGKASGTDLVTRISGVAYFTPKNPLNGADNLYINTLSLSAGSGFWDATYRTDPRWLTNNTEDPALLSSMSPVLLGIAAFAYDEHPTAAGQPSLAVAVGSTLSSITNFAGSAASPKLQRVEIPYTHLGQNGSGQFGPSNAPVEGDSLSVSVTTDMALLGDETNPSFSSNAKMRFFLRTPLGHSTVNNSALPYGTFVGGGDNANGKVIADSGNYRLLLHTTRFDADNQVGQFGNFMDGSVVASQMVNSSKDVQERFLDESYRLDDVDNLANLAINSAFGAGAGTALQGPGLGAWSLAPIEMVVRANAHAGTAFNRMGWLKMSRHLSALPSDQLQVSGLPDRNPPLSDGVKYPFPSAGVLIYPQEDFTAAGIRPANTDLSAAQPNYSGAPATGGTRRWTRCFDVSFSQTDEPLDVAGTSYVLIRLDGVTLSDFEYRAPGAGRLASEALAVSIKVPGRTTWLDLGRRDGDGPSKQDVSLDGAGCKVLGPETFDGIDSDTGMVYCQVKAHVGPSATFFKNLDTLDTGMVPMMLKVEMSEDAVGYNLRQRYDEETETFSGTDDPHVSSSRVRGLVGVRIVRPAV